LLRIPPVNVTVLEGEVAHFHCTVKNPKTMLVTWYKDGTRLADLEALSNRCILGQDGSLTVSPTEMTDLGEYECSIKGDDQEQRARAFLNVQCKFFLVSYICDDSF
jgi:immunoglobulin superfamily member 9B